MHLTDKAVRIGNAIFAIPVILFALCYAGMLGILRRDPVPEFLGYAFVVLSTPVLLVYYAAPFVGWAAPLMVGSSALGVARARTWPARIGLALLGAAYLVLLGYTVWWWATGQRFEYL